MMNQALINNLLNGKKSYGHDYNMYPLPMNSLYSIVYADPPWDYGGKMQYSRPLSTEERTAEATSAAQWQYPTMKLKELKKIDVKSILEDDALLFLWATSPHLEQAIELGKAWGFSYSTVAFVWDKQIHNPGRYTLSQCELCLLFKHGKIPSPRGLRNVRQMVSVKRGQHSQKPFEVKQRITKMFPEQSKIELFARLDSLNSAYPLKGWHHWGNELWQDKN